MQKRRLGRTGLLVSEIGYGAWGIGGGMWVGAEDEASLRALHRACDLGLNFLDTALDYGRGHSEALVGRLVRERRETIYVATKIPPRNKVWPAAPGVPVGEVFTPEHIHASAETSLGHLGLDHVDLLQLHVWRDEYLDQGQEWQDALRALKQEGKARFVGISINDHDPRSALRAVASGLFDTVQVIYNIFDQSPEAELFPLCLEKDVGVLARVPFDEGGLTGAITADTTFPKGDWRNRYFAGERKAEVHARTQALEAIMGEEAGTLAELALRFCLSHPAVSTVIPGMRRVASVEANAAVSDGRRLSPALREQLRAHAWPRNFYGP
jgi:aryl-alcohol dehydrogenase-like predicted oxidoreductase